VALFTPKKGNGKNVSCDAEQGHCTVGDYFFLYTVVLARASGE
jgi:hypothetical protein